MALARALVCRPRLLLLDEPLSALDAALREELRGEPRRLLAACDIAVFLVTHDRNEALALGDELVVMSDGAMLQIGLVMEVFNRPADQQWQRLSVSKRFSRAIRHESDDWRQCESVR